MNRSPTIVFIHSPKRGAERPAQSGREAWPDDAGMHCLSREFDLYCRAFTGDRSQHLFITGTQVFVQAAQRLVVGQLLDHVQRHSTAHGRLGQGPAEGMGRDAFKAKAGAGLASTAAWQASMAWNTGSHSTSIASNLLANRQPTLALVLR